MTYEFATHTYCAADPARRRCRSGGRHERVAFDPSLPAGAFEVAGGTAVLDV